MGEFATSKYSAEQVNEMVQAHKGAEEAIWGRHQTWKAIRIDKVRIIHAFKRQIWLYEQMGNQAQYKCNKTMGCKEMNKNTLWPYNDNKKQCSEVI